MAEILILSLLALAIAFYQALRPADRKRIKYAFSTRGKRVVLFSVGLIVILYMVGRYIETANPSFRLFCDFGCLPALFWIDILQVLTIVRVVAVIRRRRGHRESKIAIQRRLVDRAAASGNSGFTRPDCWI
jgi:hypothetical protein